MIAAGASAPSIAYFALSPMLIVFGVAVAAVVVEAVMIGRAQHRHTVQLVLALSGLAAALGMLIAVAVAVAGDGTGQSLMSGAVVIDGPALFGQGVVLLVALGAVAFMGERRLDRVWAPLEVKTAGGAPVILGETGTPAVHQEGPADAFTPAAATVPGSPEELAAARAQTITTEVFPLALFAVGGMLLFGACGDLLTMFIALEVLSLPLYLLCGLARRRRLLSQEASLKYFLLGAFASAIFLFGAAFAYGATGSLNLAEIGEAIAFGHADRTLALIATVLVVVGLLFKVGAVPFGSWVPDVYQGAPTPVSALMASATKVAAFGALLRVLHVAFPALEPDWRVALGIITLATMVLATFMAVTQTDLKRMLAYSSVSHVGFALTSAITLGSAGVAATLFYLGAYAFAAFGAFALLAVVRDSAGREEAALSSWSGLGRRSPMVGLLMSLFLLSFAGIPLTSGFIGKLVAFAAAGADGAWVLVIAGVLASAVAAWFYVRVIVSMFFATTAEPAPVVGAPSPLTTVPIGVCAAVTGILGFFPQPLLALAEAASSFLG
ncbi:NADH-quinone oxidoreductase subunit N [Gordonia hirsuta DSM 44140 = NBRC 16056]|uniref:NADH-quinone oxidoreductase subunit N n=1 Tax=Gordonia hirsuta DSM 44140 = NBRC 16056 TaxID=1121927 RepID=L7L9N3_9ACTN|nr:NADH-quinone oxidoreductase subunit NuoN [Gordonia hirsuta]GAC57624.1 NADH-quinone oxidoreductase subunit N [Gordonia hirsuta DSM 44140 = NBRC 16056]